MATWSAKKGWNCSRHLSDQQNIPKNNIILLTMASSPANNARRLKESHEVVLKMEPLLDREVGFAPQEIGSALQLREAKNKDCRRISN